MVMDDIHKKYGSSYFMRRDLRLQHPIEDKESFIKKIQKRFPSKWMNFKVREMKTTDGLKVIMEDGSWFLIRPSGTEPLLRTYTEFPRAQLTRTCLDKLSFLLYNIVKP